MTLTLSPLYILFAAEIVFLIIAFAIFMTISRAKYKRLYRGLLSQTQVVPNTPAASMPKEAEDMVSADVPIDEMIHEPDTKEGVDTGEKDVQEGEPLPIIDTAVKGQGDVLVSEDNEPAAGVNKLKKIVDFQKEKIINLMCYKDILESAQKKLTLIHGDYQDLSERFFNISEAVGSNKEFELALDMFGENTKELKDFIDALQHENESLLDKFNAWEGQLKGLWQESDDLDAGAENLDAVLAEKNEMIERIKEFEEKFKEKSKQLEEAQAQYEDLEKEYMTLYRQQQAAQQG